MSNNLFISYDLNVPGQNYEKVIEAVKALGSWSKPQKSFWYVKSKHSAREARDLVKIAMDKGDSLTVVDVTNQVAAFWGVDEKVTDHIIDKWPKK